MDAKLYEAFNIVEEKHWWFAARRDYIKAYLSRFIATDGALKLAEIGAGTGGNFNMLSLFGHLDAIEMDENAIKLAQEKIAHNHNVVSLQRGWLPDNIPLKTQYDCVVALDVIEHVENDQAAVETLVELLKPSGCLLITVPAYQWLWSSHDEVNHHYRRYTLKQLKSLFDDLNVSVIKPGYFNTLLFPVALARRLASRFFNQSNNLHSDLDLPGPLMNRALKTVFSLESRWAGKLTMPFGLSAIVMVQKNDN